MVVSYESGLLLGWWGWSLIRVVSHQVVRMFSHQGGPSSGRFYQGGEVVSSGWCRWSHQVGLSSGQWGWSLIKVVSHQGGLSSGWSLISAVSRHSGLRAVSYQDSLSWGQSLIRMVCHQDGLSAGWSLGSLIRMVPYQGGLLSEWSLIRAVSYQDGLSSGWSLIRVLFVTVTVLGIELYQH